MKRNGSDSDLLKNCSGPERFLKRKTDLANYRFLLKARDKVRDFLKSRGYLEALIPTLSPETVPDLNLESFSCKFESAFHRGEKSELYLQTSPELLLKRLLTAGFQSIFYLGPAYRQGEFAERHHPEFTMAEWYQTGCDYFHLMREIEDMLINQFGVKTPIQRITMRDALKESAGLDFFKLQTRTDLERAIKTKAGFVDTKDMDWSEMLEFAIVEWLEPWLNQKDAVFVYDWPASFSMQAKLKDGDPRLCERFELYMHGIEIANGYTESPDPQELETRLRAEVKKRKKLGRKIFPVPQRFIASLKLGFPQAAGVSVGLERLCLALLELDNLDQLMAFREI